MPLTLVQVVPPAEEPVLPSLAKQYLHNAGVVGQDGVLDLLIKSTRAEAETYLRRQLITATYSWYLDRFPRENNLAPVFLTERFAPPYHRSARHRHELLVPRPPLQVVNVIEYYDEDGVLTTLDSSQYQVDALSEPGRIRPAPGVMWPTVEHGRFNAVHISFDAGYGSRDDVPECIKNFITAKAVWAYDRRPSDDPVPAHLYSLLDQASWGAIE